MNSPKDLRPNQFHSFLQRQPKQKVSLLCNALSMIYLKWNEENLSDGYATSFSL